MSGGSKTQTTKTEEKRDPWAPAQPALQAILAGASSAYKSGAGSGVYQGDRTAGLGSDTLAGLDRMKSAAANGAPTAAAGNDWLQGLLSGGGTTAATRGAASALGGIDPTVDASGVAAAAGRLSDPGSAAAMTGRALTGGAYATDTGALKGVADNLVAGPTQTQRSLQDVANGRYLGGANPYLDDLLSRSAGEAAASVAQKFAASGRYGSGRFAGAVADAVDGVGTNLRYQDYEAERGRQASAATAIDAAANARAGQAASTYAGLAGINQGNAGLAVTGANLATGADQAALAAQQALAGLRGSNTDRAMSQAGALLTAAQGDRTAALNGISATPSAQAALQQPGQTMAQVGAIQDAARQEDIAAAMTRYDEEQAAPWRALGLYSGLANPIAGQGGTSSGTQQTKTPQPSFLQQMLGFGLAGAGVASKFI